MKISSLTMLIIVSVSLTACFSANPSESDAKEVVLAVYKEYIDTGDVIVKNVKKTDGTEMEKNGMKMYQMNVNVELEFPKGMDCKSSLGNPNFSKCLKFNFASEAVASGFTKLSPHKLTFVKSEKGWKPAPFIGFL